MDNLTEYRLANAKEKPQHLICTQNPGHISMLGAFHLNIKFINQPHVRNRCGFGFSEESSEPDVVVSPVPSDVPVDVPSDVVEPSVFVVPPVDVEPSVEVEPPVFP